MDADPESSPYIFFTPVSFIDPPLAGDGWSAILISILIPLWIFIAWAASYTRSLQILNGSTSEILKEQKDLSSKRLLTLIEEKHQFQLVLYSLISVCNVSFTVILFQIIYAISPIANASPIASFLTTVFVLSLLLILAGRIIPKLVSSRIARTFSLRGVHLAYLIHLVSKPLSSPVSRLFQSSLGYGRPEMQFLSGEDLKAMADMGEAQGTLEEDERELIHSIVDFRDAEVREVMINRMDMDAIPTTATLVDALELIKSSGHSRLPLYEEHLDNILGIVYAKDLLLYLPTHSGESIIKWTEIARPPFFVPESKALDDLLKDFQTRKMHLAIVLDDYGGTAGLVTMEDILEEIFGDIRDEFDHAEEELHEQLSETTHLFDARIHLDDLSELLNLELDTEQFDVETLGGLVFHLKGEIPLQGDEVYFESLKMRIESIENHRIGRIRIQVLPPTEDTTPVL